MAKSLKFVCLLYFFVAVLMLFLCSHLLVIFYQQCSLEIERRRGQHLGNLLVSMSYNLKQLQKATQLLENQFSVILFFMCTCIMIGVLSSALFVAEHHLNPDIPSIITFWNAFAIADVAIRFCLLCHSVDRVRSSVSQSFYSFAVYYIKTSLIIIC